jgi:hypothetical protein
MFSTMFLLLAGLYLSLRAYLWYERRAASEFLTSLEAVQIGTSADEVVKSFRKYEDKWYEEQVKYPPDSHLLRIDPWHAWHPYSRFDRLDGWVRTVLYGDGANWRRRLGLRV